MKKVGIENLVVIASLALGFGSKIGDALEDGKVTWGELVGLTPELMKLPNALKALPFVPEEIHDLDKGERHELERIIAEKFNLQGQGKENIEQIVEQTLFLGFQVAQLIASIQKLKKPKQLD